MGCARSSADGGVTNVEDTANDDGEVHGAAALRVGTGNGNDVGGEDVAVVAVHPPITRPVAGIVGLLVLINIVMFISHQTSKGSVFVESSETEASRMQHGSLSNPLGVVPTNIPSPGATNPIPPAPPPLEGMNEWKSMWNTDSLEIIESCQPFQDMMQAAERSGNAPLEGKVIGYAKKPGKNGIGDRIKAITGMAMLALAMNRPFRMSLKEDVWDFTFALRKPKQGALPWNHPWDRFDQELRRLGGRTYEHIPSKSMIDQFVNTNETFFYGALGGDNVVDGDWLETYRSKRGKGPAIKGSWSRASAMCIVRALFRPSVEVLDQLKIDIEQAAHMPMGITHGLTPATFLLGVHARYVGRKGIENGGQRLSDSDITEQVKCSWKMSEDWTKTVLPTLNLAATPELVPQVVWFIASDNPTAFFAEAKAYALAHAAELPGVMVNIAHATVGYTKHVKYDTSRPAIFRMWLDWFILNEAAACSFGQSGFPRTACIASQRLFLSRGTVQEGFSGCGSWNTSTISQLR
jgi:hypothetical protein